MTEADSALVEAFAQGDITRARKALASGANPNLSPDGYPLICTAAGRGNLAAVAALLEHGADANARDLNQMTPAIWAAMECEGRDSTPILERLHSAGADLNARASDRRTALDCAIDTHRPTHSLGWLIKHGATGSKASMLIAQRLVRNEPERGTP